MLVQKSLLQTLLPHNLKRFAEHRHDHAGAGMDAELAEYALKV